MTIKERYDYSLVVGELTKEEHIRLTKNMNSQIQLRPLSPDEVAEELTREHDCHISPEDGCPCQTEV